jgi:UDP-N-acetylmuramoylalanine--D-glutamate ligase
MKTITLILGMGLSGQSVALFLQKKNLSFLAVDDNHDAMEFGPWLTNFEDIPWDKIKTVVQSPGVPFSNPVPHRVTQKAIELGVPIITDIDLFQDYRDPAIACVGITGTNGKSTTTALITHIINTASNKKAIMGGNIGVPALSLLDQTDIDFYVLELSSYQLEITKKIDLNVAVLLNLTEDHIDRHGSMEAYKAAKEKIFNNAKNMVRGESLHPYVSLETLPQHSKLQGFHNVQNINAAFTVCKLLGFDDATIFKGLESFKGLEHRMEIVMERPNLLIVNDSKATNADAAERALVSYKGLEIYWILGGVSKEGGISSLCRHFQSIKKTYLIGASVAEFKDCLNAAQHTPQISVSHRLDRAVSEALGDIHNSKSHLKKVLLFSPACASFDQFKNFQHRGEVFKKLVFQHDFSYHLEQHGSQRAWI